MESHWNIGSGDLVLTLGYWIGKVDKVSKDLIKARSPWRGSLRSKNLENISNTTILSQVSCVNGAETGRDSSLPNNVVKQYLRQGAIIHCLALFTVNLLWHPAKSVHIVHHLYSVDHLIREIEVSFHDKNGKKIADESATMFFSSITESPQDQRERAKSHSIVSEALSS